MIFGAQNRAQNRLKNRECCTIDLGNWLKRQKYKEMIVTQKTEIKNIIFQIVARQTDGPRTQQIMIWLANSGWDVLDKHV